MTPRYLVTFFALLLPSLLMAEPLVYICERPEWRDREGCGPNNTHSTFAFHVETDDFRLKNPHYTFQSRSGCDLKNAAKIRFNYTVSGDEILFQYTQPIGQWGRFYTIRLNQNTLIAELGGVGESPFLTCEVKKSESWVINNPTYRQ